MLHMSHFANCFREDSRLHSYSTPPTSQRPKANTVAGPVYSPDELGRPPVRPRHSYISVPDSGYGSAATIPECITTSTQAPLKDTDLISVDTFPPVVTDAPPPPPPSSVKTEPISGGTKRRRSKTFNKKCEECDRELKNPSESA